jgi:protein-glutamine gamma-glutamyltransferase
MLIIANVPQFDLGTLPMSFDRALQLHTAALVIFGAVFVGQRQDAVLVPALAAMAAVASVAITDVLGWLRLNRWVANGIAIFAVGWSLREFFEIASEEKLLAIANMLCYLQIVLLFQQKALRVYWQLVVLSILQVVVAAALDLGPEFGLLLAFYAMVALSTLLLLCVIREVRQDEPAANKAAVAKPAVLLLAAPEVEAPVVSERLLTRALPVRVIASQVTLLSFVTLLFAGAFFYATPRLSDNSWLGGKARGAGSSGFRPEVRLEERGRIHLSSQVVMRVALSRMLDRRPISLVGEPYFQGEILNEYRHDENGGRWLPRRPSLLLGMGSGGRRGMWQTFPQTTISLVRQDIILEANAQNRRFEVAPAQPLSDTSISSFGPQPRYEMEGHVVARHRRYSVATPAIISGRQLHAIPNPNRLLTLNDGVALAEEERITTEFEADRFPRLAAVAAEVVDQQRLKDADRLGKALALERHFLMPDQYQYSLNLNFTRDEDLDPVEDFVANHRTGHCEYFASALVLMLRSQGIPARMIVGYKGGVFNSVGQYYVVQQRHAHAWVESWIENDQVPPGDLAGPPSDGGAWYRLDPTPGRELYTPVDEQTMTNRVAQAFDYVELLWRDYVLSLNKNRQEDVVFEPLTAKASMLPSWVESRNLRRFLQRLSADLGLDFSWGQTRGGRRAFEGSLAVLVMCLLLGLVGLFQGTRMLGRAIGRWIRAKAVKMQSRSPAFYQRLEHLLGRLHLERAIGQTPSEFAAEAADRLMARHADGSTAHLPQGVVSAYYRVRFGGDRLDKTEMDGIEQSLVKIERAVAKGSRS